MGIALSQPVTSKRLFRAGNALFRAGAATMQGWRCNMEDAHTIALTLPGHADAAFFGIFDGHGGEAVSRLLATELVKSVAKLRDLHDPKELRKACLELDDQILRQVFSDDGSTAVFAVVTKLKGTAEYKLTVGNVGDSRVILGRWRNGQLSMIPMTQDHKPTDQKEAERIVKAGGTVQAGRVAGSLALSRAFGDRKFKVPLKSAPDKMQVIAVPDFKTTTVGATDFLLLACDGIFESEIFTRQGVIGYLHYKLEVKGDLADVCAELLEECLKRGSNDNMSAMLIQFVDGSAYHREDVEFVPGPYHDGERHTSFQKAYADDAKESGYSLEQARALFTKKGGHTQFKEEPRTITTATPIAPTAPTTSATSSSSGAVSTPPSLTPSAPSASTGVSNAANALAPAISGTGSGNGSSSSGTTASTSSLSHDKNNDTKNDNNNTKSDNNKNDNKNDNSKKEERKERRDDKKSPTPSPNISTKGDHSNSTSTTTTHNTNSTTNSKSDHKGDSNTKGDSKSEPKGDSKSEGSTKESAKESLKSSGDSAPTPSAASSPSFTTNIVITGPTDSPLRKSNKDKREGLTSSGDAIRPSKSSPAMSSSHPPPSDPGGGEGASGSRHSHHVHSKSTHSHKVTKTREREASAPAAVVAPSTSTSTPNNSSTPKKTHTKEAKDKDKGDKERAHKRSSSSAALNSRSEGKDKADTTDLTKDKDSKDKETATTTATTTASKEAPARIESAETSATNPKGSDSSEGRDKELRKVRSETEV